MAAGLFVGLALLVERALLAQPELQVVRPCRQQRLLRARLLRGTLLAWLLPAGGLGRILRLGEQGAARRAEAVAVLAGAGVAADVEERGGVAAGEEALRDRGAVLFG